MKYICVREIFAQVVRSERVESPVKPICIGSAARVGTTEFVQMQAKSTDKASFLFWLSVNP